MKTASQRAPRQPTMTEFLRRTHGTPCAASERHGGECQRSLAPGHDSHVSMSDFTSAFGRAAEVVSPSLTPRQPRVKPNVEDGTGPSRPGCGVRATCTSKRQRLACGSGAKAADAAERTIDTSSSLAQTSCRGRRELTPASAGTITSEDESDGRPSCSPPSDTSAPLRTYGRRRRLPSAFSPAQQADVVVGQSHRDGDAAAKVVMNKENVPSDSAIFCASADACESGKPVPESDRYTGPCRSGPVVADCRPGSSAVSSKSPPTSACRNLIQTRLDLGQKEIFGDPRLCPRCGMMYTPGNESDEFLHRRFHSKAEDALKFPGWKNEDVVLENPDGSRVICIQPSARGHVLAKLAAVQAIMDEELGAHDSSTLLQHNRKAYLYISPRSSQQQIKGVCVAEPIACAYRLLGGSGSAAMASDEQEPACCGIYRLWVCRTGRRQGVATCLLNAVRMHCIPGRYVSEDRLAFSDPTELGKLFAASYTRNGQVLIYK